MAEYSSHQKQDTYAGFLDNFACEIGSTLDDLASDWMENEDDFEENEKTKNVMKDLSSRTSSFMSQLSMNSFEGMQDLSLKKARPLYFANPVYDLMNPNEVIKEQRHMTLIPLSQFNVNKESEDPSKSTKQKHKKGSHGLITKLSHFTMRKHSIKKHEQDMIVTAPLWTDAPGIKYDFSDAVQRSASLKSPKNNEATGSSGYGDDMTTKRPMSLDFEETEKAKNYKSPPVKLPRTSKGAHSPLSPKKEYHEPTNDNVFEGNDCDKENLAEHNNVLQLPATILKSAGSSNSISSELSEDNPSTEEEQDTKTMMQVMGEINEKSEDILVEQNANENEIKESPQVMKRNKTLKWSGSRAAPTLIREFSRNSRKNQNSKMIAESVIIESPNSSVDNSPSRSPVPPGDSEKSNELKPESKTASQLKVSSSSTPTTPSKRDTSAFEFLSSLLPPAPKLRRTESTKIRMYIHKMGTNPQNALGYAAMQFVEQILASPEHRPIVLLHSIRSFLTDIKKYLIINPHVGFMQKIHKIVRNSVITDTEGAIDDALERLILYPLRDHVYKCLVLDYARAGKIQLLDEAIKCAKAKTNKELGIRETLIPPNDEAIEIISQHFTSLQTTYSPYNKLKHLLSAVTTIYQNTCDLTCEDRSARKIGADDFLPLLVYSIMKCKFTAADIEAQYIDGLLDPALLLGEGGYYLTTMISAVQVLCSMKRREAALPNISDLQGFLKVGISSKAGKPGDSPSSIPEDESKDKYLLHKTLHVPPSMTSHNLGLMIAKKYKIKDPKSYCLHVVVNGVAYPLKPQEFPQLVKMDLLTQYSSSSFFFIFRQKAENPETREERPKTMDTEKLKINTEDNDDYEVSGNALSDKIITPSPTAEDERYQSPENELPNMDIENQDQEENSEVPADDNSENLVDDHQDLCDTEDSSVYDEMDAAYESGDRVDVDIDNYEQSYTPHTNRTGNNNVSLKKKKTSPPPPEDLTGEDSEYDNLEEDIPRKKEEENDSHKDEAREHHVEDVANNEGRYEGENLGGDNKKAEDHEEETDEDVEKEDEGTTDTAEDADIKEKTSMEAVLPDDLENQSSIPDKEEVIEYEEESVDVQNLTENHEDETSSVASGVSSGTEPELENIRSSESSEEEDEREEEQPIPSPSPSGEDYTENQPAEEKHPIPPSSSSGEDSAENQPASPKRKDSEKEHPALFHLSPTKIIIKADASTKDNNDVFRPRPIEEIHSFAKIDQGTNVPVQVLKNFFEDEITRVTPDPGTGKRNQSSSSIV